MAEGLHMSFSFSQPGGRAFVPDGSDVDVALARTTHLAIGAHADDVEFMAWWPIHQCASRDDLWLTAIVVADGRGSPRSGPYAGTSDTQMRDIRFGEQCEAARLGRYSAVLCLDHTSEAIRARPADAGARGLRAELSAVVGACGAREVYTHSLADRHDTHAALAVAVVDAICALPEAQRPHRLFGGEVWGALDWLCESDKTVFDVSDAETLMESLMGVFASQLEGGKRYDLATLGRKRANATYLHPREVDRAAALDYALDMTPLVREPSLDPRAFVRACIQRFQAEVEARLERFC